MGMGAGLDFENYAAEGEEIVADDGIEEATVVDEISEDEVIEVGDGTDEIEVEV